MSLLEVNDINVYYGAIHAIKGISFSVDEGEVVTLIGANGAGKSTVLNTVSGLLHPKHAAQLLLGKVLCFSQFLQSVHAALQFCFLYCIL